LQATSPNPNPPTFGTVGKVFNSLQGLQQRLDDFSLDDLSKAIDTSKTLSLRLAQLQKRLGILIEIRQFITKTRLTIERSAVDIRSLADLETPIQAPIPESAQISNVIEFPRPPRFLSDANEETAKTIIERSTLKDEGVTQARKDHSVVIQPTDNSKLDAEWSLAPDLTTFDPGEEWTFDSDASTSPEEQPFIKDNTQGEIAGLENPKMQQTHAVANLGRIGEKRDTIGSEPTEMSDSLLSESEQKPAPFPEEEQILASTTPGSSEAKALVAAGTDFDQRLLDDLIKDYGEFASSPYVPVPVTPKNEAKISKENNDHTSSTQSPDEADSATRHLPSIRKEGEIDRKLKKLIKDYGEYDLYSHQSPVNLRTGVLGAFVLLALIFSGFYFFSAPKTVDSSPTSSATEPPSLSAPNRAGLQRDKTHNAAKTPKESPGAFVERSPSIEASEAKQLPLNPVEQKN